jgi:NADH:ubiquinone oxidoreductase subunit 6 (subunit J)
MNTAIPRAFAVVALALLFIGAILQVDWPSGDMDPTTSREVGQTLFGKADDSGYGLIMMLIGLLLLVAMLGGVFLAKEEKP